MRRRIAIAACLALALSNTAAQAEPARPCITDREMHGLVGYFLPSVLDEVTNNCRPHLPADSYLLAGMPLLTGSLAAAKEAAWPTARAAFFKISEPGDAKKMASLSDKALRPLVDELLEEKMSIKVTAPMCGEINDITQALSPLSPEQTVHLVATIFSTIARKDNKMRSCPRTEG